VVWEYAGVPGEKTKVVKDLLSKNLTMRIWETKPT